MHVLLEDKEKALFCLILSLLYTLGIFINNSDSIRCQK